MGKESQKGDETLENISKPSRSYRKKEPGEEDKDEDKQQEGLKVKPARRKKKEKNNSKPELPRYDVRRILDKKKEEKKDKKEKMNKNEDALVDGAKRPEHVPSKDEFGRDVDKKSSEKFAARADRVPGVERCRKKDG